MCYIVFISYSLHWYYIEIAMQEYVITISLYCINATKYCTKSMFCGIDAITVLSYGQNF